MKEIVNSVPFVVCVLGLVGWYIFTRPKFEGTFWPKVAEWCFIVGLLWTVYEGVNKPVF